MKKIILLVFVPLISLFSLSAQITHAEADSIIIERMSAVIKPYTIYAKEEMQTGFEITTFTGEVLELNYLCWIYYVNFIKETNDKYLIVKESNGNLLEINAKNDKEPADLEVWRIVGYSTEIPFEEYSLVGTSCRWLFNLINFDKVITINSNQELESFIICTNGSYHEIDFSKHSLLLAQGMSVGRIPKLLNAEFLKNNANEYALSLTIFAGIMTSGEPWCFAFLVPKMPDDEVVTLHVTYRY